uniref:Retrotransposon gag domain-containing protein n=1 Tax=Glossina pallidipes TaxID=7398 RepID=A0A1A9ZQY1_GLOPL
MEKKYGSKYFKKESHLDLSTRRQKRNETVQDYATEIKHLAHFTYVGVAEFVLERLNTYAFVERLRGAELRKAIRTFSNAWTRVLLLQDGRSACCLCRAGCYCRKMGAVPVAYAEQGAIVARWVQCHRAWHSPLIDEMSRTNTLVSSASRHRSVGSLAEDPISPHVHLAFRRWDAGPLTRKGVVRRIVDSNNHDFSWIVVVSFAIVAAVVEVTAATKAIEGSNCNVTVVVDLRVVDCDCDYCCVKFLVWVCGGSGICNSFVLTMIRLPGWPVGEEGFGGAGAPQHLRTGDLELFVSYYSSHQTNLNYKIRLKYLFCIEYLHICSQWICVYERSYGNNSLDKSNRQIVVITRTCSSKLLLQ